MARKLALAALAVFAGFSVAQPGSAQSLDEVLERHYEAMGGADAWANLQTMQGSGTMSIAGGMVEGPFEMVQKRPAMYRLDIDVQGMQIVQAYDGTTAWEVNPMLGSGPREADAATAAGIRENSDLDGPLVGWKEDGHKVELLGEDTVDGASTIKLGVEVNGNPSTYYLDAESYLIVKVESTTAGIAATSRLSDYREVGGLQFAFSVAIESAQGPLELLFDSIEVDVEIDDAQFSMGGH